jgi:hypothetical protein
MALTKKQAIEANEFHLAQCRRIFGPRGGITETVIRYRRNGVTKLWKTEPERFRIPVKYGMKTCDYITNENQHRVHAAEDCPLNDPNFGEKKNG